MTCKHCQRHPKRWCLVPVRGLRAAASVLSAALLTSLIDTGATSAAAATCASLAGLALADTTITAAESVAAGAYTAPDGEVFTSLPAFCRIAATLTPSSDSDIKIEVWMPGPPRAMGRTRHRTGPDHCVPRGEWCAGLFTPGLPLSGAAALQRGRRYDKSQQFHMHR
jgi:hypothetical protein